MRDDVVGVEILAESFTEEPTWIDHSSEGNSVLGMVADMVNR